MLFCLSFTPSARFLQADQFVTRLQRDEFRNVLQGYDKIHAHVIGKRDRERVGVRCSVLVGNDLPHSPPIDVRQNAASVRVPVLVDEQLQES